MGVHRQRRDVELLSCRVVLSCFRGPLRIPLPMGNDEQDLGRKMVGARSPRKLNEGFPPSNGGTGLFPQLCRLGRFPLISFGFLQNPDFLVRNLDFSRFIPTQNYHRDFPETAEKT